MYVFAYGSLLSRASLSTTLPEVSPAQCVPALLDGYERTFDVAFPNDGSQPDKIYRRDGGTDPAVVLFANLRPGLRRLHMHPSPESCGIAAQGRHLGLTALGEGSRTGWRPIAR